MKFISVTTLIVLCSALKVKSQDLSSTLGNVVQSTENMTVSQKWQAMEKNLKKVIGDLVKMAMPHVLKASESMNISSVCMQEGMKIVLGLKNLEPWAFRFIDSSGKLPDGLLVGALSALGVYDECINIEVKNERGKDRGKVHFRGKYCMIDINPPLPPEAKFYSIDETMPELKNLALRGNVVSELLKWAPFFYIVNFKFAVCVPSGCSVEDIDQVVKKLGDYAMVEAKTYRCEMKEEMHFDYLNICVMFVYCFFGFLMLIGSLIEMYSYYKGVVFKSTPARIFLSFSFISNFKKLVDTKSASDTLVCLHGVRFLSMSWVIIAHTYLLMNFQIIQNADKARIWGKTFAFQVIMNGTLAVDVFFCMGGMLVCYQTIKHVNIEGKSFNVLMYIVHRLCRIYPVYIMAFLFMFNIPVFLSGPTVHSLFNPYIETCYDKWWQNFLFINNFFRFTETCMQHTWYIATDFQLYIGALIILLPMIRWPKIGISLSVMAIIASMMFAGVQTYVHDLPPTLLFMEPDPESMTKYQKNLYFTPIAHAVSYSIGILAGYLLATKPNFKMSASVQVVGWIAAFICSFSTLYGVYNWNSGKEINYGAGMMYAIFQRFSWSVGIAWMIVCCVTGHGGVVNYILSWKIFIPLGRLTFLAYLIHPYIQLMFMGHLRTVFEPDHFFLVWTFFGHLCVTYAVSFVGCMLVEAPMISLEKIIFGRGGKKLEDPPSPGRNIILEGTLKAEMNGDIAVIVNGDQDKSLGLDNTSFTKL